MLDLEKVLSCQGKALVEDFKTVSQLIEILCS